MNDGKTLKEHIIDDDSTVEYKFLGTGCQFESPGWW